MARSYFYGINGNGELVGGDTALITSNDQVESLFKWFKDRDVCVGFIATEIEAGFFTKTEKIWYGDESYKKLLDKKLEERYPGLNCTF